MPLGPQSLKYLLSESSEKSLLALAIVYILKIGMDRYKVDEFSNLLDSAKALSKMIPIIYPPAMCESTIPWNPQGKLFTGGQKLPNPKNSKGFDSTITFLISLKHLP